MPCKVFGQVLFFCSPLAFLDCTDGNLARATGRFSVNGKWLDIVGDRLTQSFVFMGTSIYFLTTASSIFWAYTALLDAIFLLIYYYAVDIAAAQKISQPVQEIGKLNFKGVHVKWGLYEPTIYGFVFLAPVGLLKVHIIFILLAAPLAILYQFYKNIILLGKAEHTGHRQ